MITSFSEGFLLGLGAAIPLGPINILIMNQALTSYKAAVFLGFGAMSADVFYLLLILAGMIGFINNGAFLYAVGIFGSLFLLYLALGIYKNRANEAKVQAYKITPQKVFKTYAQGFILTLLNPYTIIFWFSVAGYAASRHLEIRFTLLGMIASILLWTTLMPYAVHRTKHKISQKVSLYLNTLSALILSGFALALFIDTLW